MVAGDSGGGQFTPANVRNASSLSSSRDCACMCHIPVTSPISGLRATAEAEYQGFPVLLPLIHFVTAATYLGRRLLIFRGPRLGWQGTGKAEIRAVMGWLNCVGAEAEPAWLLSWVT